MEQFPPAGLKRKGFLEEEVGEWAFKDEREGREFLAEQTVTYEKGEGVTFGGVGLGTGLVGWEVSWRDWRYRRCWAQDFYCR